jgi:hypothetical protein
MTAEIRTIIIETPMGERFEAEVPCDMRIGNLSVDFFEAQGWPMEQRGRRAVVEWVNPRNSNETRRLNGDKSICEEGVEDGDTLRIFPESVGGDASAIAGQPASEMDRLLDEWSARFENRLGALEKRLDETAASLTRLTQTLEQRAQNSNDQSDPSIATLAAALRTLADSLHSQPIAFRSLPPQRAQQSLFQVLRDYFSLAELRELCFSLEIPYADLPGDTLSDKAREVTAYAQRHGQWAELETAVRRLRPRVQWEHR